MVPRALSRNLVAVLSASVVTMACAGGGYGPSQASVGLDVTGASNTACDVTVSNGNATVMWNVAAPMPVVPDTSVDTRAPPGLWCDSGDAATVSVTVVSATTQNVGTVSASRTSTQLCFKQPGSLAGTFCPGGQSGCPNACPVAVTLTCAGLTFYDHVSWNLCQFFG